MWPNNVRRRGASQLPARRVAGARRPGRALRDNAVATPVERTHRVAGVRPSRAVTRGGAAPSLPPQRQLAARQPHITMHLAGSTGHAHRVPPDRALSEPSIRRPAAGQSRQLRGAPDWYEPEWSRPGVAVELVRAPVVTEPLPTIVRRVPKPIAVACVVAVAGLITGGVTAYLLTRHGGSARVGSARPSSAHARTVSTPVQQAETWVTTNVAADTPLCADRVVAAHLGRAGFTAVSTCRPDDRWDKNRFLVSTPDIHAAIAGSLAAEVEQKASLPVAVFGAKTERVEVRMVVPGAQAALSARLARDVHERAFAAATLLRNPAVTATASARAALGRGQLDLRAAPLLALLAARTPVRVDTITIRPPEAAAGRPARSITISVTDPAALTATTRTLTGDYIPELVTAAGGGATRLDWAVGLAPNPDLG
jgi:hypothetical protein